MHLTRSLLFRLMAFLLIDPTSPLRDRFYLNFFAITSILLVPTVYYLRLSTEAVIGLMALHFHRRQLPQGLFLL